MAQTKTIAFKSNKESHSPFITDSSAIEMVENSKQNYSATKHTEEFHPESNYSTVSSTNTAYQKDTVVLLHRHNAIEEEVRRRSLKATFCMIFAIVLIIGLVGMAIASLHYKMTNKNAETGTNQNTEMVTVQNITTLPELEGTTNLNFNFTEDLSKHNNTLPQK